MTLYKAIVRSKPEYCCRVWSPSKVQDIKALENIQRNFTKKIAGCQDLDYWDRLKKLKLPAAKTGTILYHPRLENAEWVSTKQHQNGVSRAQPTGDQNNSAPIKQQGPDLGQNGLWKLVQNKCFPFVELAPKVHQHRHFAGGFQGVSRGMLEKNPWHPTCTWLHRCEQKLAARLEQRKRRTHMMPLSRCEPSQTPKTYQNVRIIIYNV